MTKSYSAAIKSSAKATRNIKITKTIKNITRALFTVFVFINLLLYKYIVYDIKLTWLQIKLTWLQIKPYTFKYYF